MRKARVKLQQEQAKLLLSGKAVTIRLPGVDITELEISLNYVSDEDRKKIADKFRDIGKKASGLDSRFRDIFGEDLFGDLFKN